MNRQCRSERVFDVDVGVDVDDDVYRRCRIDVDGRVGYRV